MTTTADDLPDDIAALQAALIAERARAARVEAELAVAKARASDDQALIAAAPYWWYDGPDRRPGAFRVLRTGGRLEHVGGGPRLLPWLIRPIRFCASSPSPPLRSSGRSGHAQGLP